MKISFGVKVVQVGLVSVLALACGHGGKMPAARPPPKLPDLQHTVARGAEPESYWEPVEADVRGAPKSVELPLSEAAVVRSFGAARVWEELGNEGRQRLLRDGVVVLGDNTPLNAAKLGSFYLELRERRTPYWVTFDVLEHLVSCALDRVLAELDETLVAPELEALLERLEARLFAEQKNAGTEVRAALHLARNIVAVARTLISGPSLGADPAVAAEVARVVQHDGVAPSPVLEVPMDYARFAVPELAGRPGHFRALVWLSSATLLFGAKSEVSGGVVNVATARGFTRASMLLGRVADREYDDRIFSSWSKLARLFAFVWGSPDDLGPAELMNLASSVGVKITDSKHVANVVMVDRLRHRASRGRQPLLFDGVGAAARAGIGLRLFGGHASPDMSALLALTSRARALPATLDLAVWFGAPEARSALHESGADGWAGYDAALGLAIGARPAEDSPQRHASVHASLMDAVSAWLLPTTARTFSSIAARRLALESGLSAWTRALHVTAPFSRPSHRAQLPSPELRVAGPAIPAFVEAAPDAIARLKAVVGQIKRGIVQIGNLPPNAPSMVGLAEVDDMLQLALRVACSSANDEAPSSDDESALASFPARIERLDHLAELTAPMVSEVVVDGAGDKVLSSAIGSPEPVVTVVREPGTERLILVVGAHVAHYELVEQRSAKTTDATLAARLRDDPGSVRRAAYTSAFRMVRGSLPR